MRTPPLEGIRVLELASQYPGPYCSFLLAGMGAEVIKVERPGSGDPARQFPEFFLALNGSKKSLTVDLKSPEGREILYRLVKTSDVFLEGFRPGVAARLRIDFEAMREVNPKLIYCSISGYGQQGPYKNLPGHDLNYVAMAGMLHCFRDENGNFITPGIAIADLSAGMFAAIGILGCLHGRNKMGEGAFIDISMFDGLLSWMSTRLSILWATGKFERDRDAGYGIFMGNDNNYFTLAIAHEDWFWDRLCAAIGLTGRQGIKAKERRARKAELAKELQTIFSTRPSHEWVHALIEADVPVAPIKAPEEIESDPHVIERKMLQDVDLPEGRRVKLVGFPIKILGMPQRVMTRPPALGEHTEEILEALGYEEEAVRGLRERGIV